MRRRNGRRLGFPVTLRGVRLRYQIQAAVTAAVLGGLGVAVHLAAQHVDTETTRLAHEIRSFAWLPVIILPLPLVYLLVELRARERARWPRVVVSALVQLVVSVALAAAVVVADPDFPLGPTLQAKVVAPGGGRTAYLYRGFLCTLYLYERPGGAWVMERKATIPRNSCDLLVAARPAWDPATGEPHVVWPDGSEVEPQTWDLVLGPR